MKPSLSVILITKNSERTIRQCLVSVAWASEMIVLDSGSTDRTVSICREYTDHVFETDWPGFGIQKNRALEKATGEWVLSIDSDEWMDGSLQKEITAVIQSSKCTVFEIKRQNYYLGQRVRFGDVGNDWVIRLFKRGDAAFSNDLVHEKIITDQKIGKLKSILHHDSYPTVAGLMQRMNDYTTLSANTRFERGKKTSISRAFFAGFWAFIKSYFLRLGFLDGRIGLIVAVSSAQSSYYRHVKLWESSARASKRRR